MVLQIGAQAKAAIRQNAHNEGLKLKLSLYERIIRTCNVASRAEVKLSSFVHGFSSSIETYKIIQRTKAVPSVPKVRFAQFIEFSAAMYSGAIQMISIIERWQILDPRMVVFQTAINVALHDTREAEAAYVRDCASLMPSEMASQPGTLFPWSPPNSEQEELLRIRTEDLLDALMKLGNVIYDFTVEMQNSLLGDLFQNRIPARTPVDPRFIVVTLDNHAHLASYFEKETAWGKVKSDTEKRVRENLTGAGK